MYMHVHVNYMKNKYSFVLSFYALEHSLNHPWCVMSDLESLKISG